MADSDSDYSVQQVWAIEKSIDAARKYQSSLGPGILEDRRVPMTYLEIASNRGLMGATGLSKKCMSSFVHYVLFGYQGGNSSFGGIIGDDEAKAIKKKISQRFYATSLGELSEEEIREITSNAGEASRDKKAGIHGRDKEAVGRDSRLGGRNSVISRGMIPWEFGERLTLYFLDKSGMYTNKEIVPTLNNLWRNDRSYKSVRVQLSRFKKKHNKLVSILS